MKYLFLFGLLTIGCAHARPEPIRFKASDASGPAIADAIERPLIVEVEAGDVIPVAFVIDGDDIGTATDQPPIRLVAKRHFFLHVDKDGVGFSDDGISTDKGVALGNPSFYVGTSAAGLRTGLRLAFTPRRLRE